MSKIKLNLIRVIRRDIINSVMNENMILREVKSEFTVRMLKAFQDRQNLYIVMPYLSGGDLRRHMITKQYFNEKQVKFFIACIILGLEALHTKNIIHRDLKPENLLFDEKGYLYVIDFGVARYWRPDNFKDSSGTPAYMAPECLCGRNYNYQADFYALGVILYELIMKKRPYGGETNRKLLKEAVCAKQIMIGKPKKDSIWSSESISFCNGLIERRKHKRIGQKGIEELKRHVWFDDFDWSDLQAKTMEAPFVPHLPGFISQFNYKENINPNKEDTVLLNSKKLQNLFKSFEYDENNYTKQLENLETKGSPSQRII